MSELYINDEYILNITGYTESFNQNAQMLSIRFRIEGSGAETTKNVKTKLRKYLDKNSINNIKIYEENKVLSFESEDYTKIMSFDFSENSDPSGNIVKNGSISLRIEI